MTDLTTTYLGIKLKNPIVASASPLSKKVDVVKRLEEAGASAVVMYSLFEEQIIHESRELDHYLTRGTDSNPEASTYFPDMGSYNIGPDAYLEHISRLKQAVSIPVIASLNGVSRGGWINYARRMESSGADALELNFYYIPTEKNLSGQQLEDNYIDLVRAIRSEVRIPLSIKLSPFFSALPNFAHRLVEAGANGLVLFNRFIQPDLDIEELAVLPHLVLSTSAELRLPLRWIAILHGREDVDLALTGGVHQVEDIVKSLMAGACVTCLASELIENGISRVGQLVNGLNQWLTDHEYSSVSQMIGSMSQKNVVEPAAYERGNYMKALQAFDNRSF